MEENKEEVKQEEVKQDSDFKQETVKTFNEAKEKMKNINLKQEAEVGKGILKKIWKKPVETIKEIAEDKENKSFRTAILLVAVWAVIILIDEILYYLLNEYIKFNFLSTLKITLAPVLRVIAMTFAVYIVNNRAKDSISKILTSVTFSYVPSIISSLLWVLDNVSSKMYILLTPISGLLRVISIVLMYQTVKALILENEEEKSLKTFVKVEAVFYVIVFAISFLGISL